MGCKFLFVVKFDESVEVYGLDVKNKGKVILEKLSEVYVCYEIKKIAR